VTPDPEDLKEPRFVSGSSEVSQLFGDRNAASGVRKAGSVHGDCVFRLDNHLSERPEAEEIYNFKGGSPAKINRGGGGKAPSPSLGGCANFETQNH